MTVTEYAEASLGSRNFYGADFMSHVDIQNIQTSRDLRLRR